MPPGAPDFRSPCVSPFGGADGRISQVLELVPGALPGLPPLTGPDPAAFHAARETRPVRRGPGNAAEGVPELGPVPGPDRGRVGRLAAPYPRQPPGRRGPQVRRRRA